MRLKILGKLSLVAKKSTHGFFDSDAVHLTVYTASMWQNATQTDTATRADRQTDRRDDDEHLVHGQDVATAKVKS